jgi:hypothetical protein
MFVGKELPQAPVPYVYVVCPPFTSVATLTFPVSKYENVFVSGAWTFAGATVSVVRFPRALFGGVVSCGVVPDVDVIADSS